MSRLRETVDRAVKLGTAQRELDVAIAAVIRARAVLGDAADVAEYLDRAELLMHQAARRLGRGGGDGPMVA